MGRKREEVGNQWCNKGLRQQTGRSMVNWKESIKEGETGRKGEMNVRR